LERYFSFSRYLREIFKEKVFRITVDAGFTCPNRDGKKGTGGCIYCYSGSDYDVEKRKRSGRCNYFHNLERNR